MIFHDYEFKTFLQRRKFRIEEKSEFEKSWHSFVDVQAIIKLRTGIKYVIKYLSKTKYAVQSQTLTQALCWLFKKRSFAVSGDFHEAIYSITKIHYRFIQKDLFNNTIDSKVEWVLIGIYSAETLAS